MRFPTAIHLRQLTFLCTLLLISNALLHAQQPSPQPRCINLEVALGPSHACDRFPTNQRDSFFVAWRSSLDAANWQSIESLYQDVETVATNHAQGGTGPQSDADMAGAEYACAKASRIDADENTAASSNAVLQLLLTECFTCVTFPTERPALTHTLEELKVLAVQADCRIRPLEQTIASINCRITCASNELANSRLTKRREALAAEIHSLRCRLTQCSTELHSLTEAVQKKVGDLHERFTKADNALTDISRFYPAVTLRAVTTNTQKYREGTGNVEKCFDAIERHRKTAGNANAMLIATWHLHSELKLLICTLP